MKALRLLWIILAAVAGRCSSGCCRYGGVYPADWWAANADECSIPTLDGTLNDAWAWGAAPPASGVTGPTPGHRPPNGPRGSRRRVAHSSHAAC